MYKGVKSPLPSVFPPFFIELPRFSPLSAVDRSTMKALIALVLAAAAAASPLAKRAVSAHTVSLVLQDGSSKDVGTLQGSTAASGTAACVALPLDTTWTGLSVKSAAGTAAGTSCAHVQGMLPKR